MEFSRQAIDALIKAVADDRSGFTWLLENNEKALAAFSASFNGNGTARTWLQQNNVVLFKWLQAIEQNESALAWLLQNHKTLAAVAGGANGHKDSLLWLEQNDHQSLAELAMTLNNY